MSVFAYIDAVKGGKLTVFPYGETGDPAVQTSDHTSHICNRPLCYGLIDAGWFMYQYFKATKGGFFNYIP